MNLKLLRLESTITVHNVDTLRWLKSLQSNVRSWGEFAWVLFCLSTLSALATKNTRRLLPALEELWRLAPSGSWVVCETEQDFEISKELPAIAWDVRKYKPAYVAVAQK